MQNNISIDIWKINVKFRIVFFQRFLIDFVTKKSKNGNPKKEPFFILSSHTFFLSIFQMISFHKKMNQHKIYKNKSSLILLLKLYENRDVLLNTYIIFHYLALRLHSLSESICTLLNEPLWVYLIFAWLNIAGVHLNDITHAWLECVK